MSEPEGGDAACWAHLVDDGLVVDGPFLAGVVAVDLAALATSNPQAVPWSTRSTDLDVNLLHFRAGDGVAAHINTDLDVLLIGVTGEGDVLVDGEPFLLRPGRVVVIPKGRSRETRATSEHFSYLSCHRARPGLMPVPRPPKDVGRAR